MPKRVPTADSQAPQPPKPSGSKGLELPRSIRPSHLKPSSTQPSSSHRNFKVTSSPKLTRSDDGNNSNPSSPHTSARESEPATDEEAHLGGSLTATGELADPGNHFQLDNSERQAIAMFNKITKRSARNHQKYDAFRANISGKDKRIDELHASLEDLACQTAGLEKLCNSDVDADALEKLFMAIPIQQRRLYLGE
ncbi:hypothetical protein PHYPSEUDO_012786 [Phytophthora pseudosyringae]|uniref:Uncharacterized protein n=1 Tax=Phytophthora pseudosyringae TaxID=221518 RepID=A0A8T1V6V7_9STRA|nr:hypothetical protein PHYPSEUDO_012786 [Phytophthora pseudosyringae]